LRVFFSIYIWVPFFGGGAPENVVNLSCGTEEETTVHVLSGCEALVSHRHAYLGSFILGPENVTNLSMGAIENFGKGTGLL
jgi:hypothetical protein